MAVRKSDDPGLAKQYEGRRERPQMLQLRREDVSEFLETTKSILESNARLADLQCQNVEAINHLTQIYQKYVEEDRNKLNKLYEEVIEGNGKPSQRERLNRHDAYIEGRRRLEWLVLGVLVTQTVIFAFAFFWTVYNHVYALPK